jgi:hypothetical protein
VLFGFRLRDVDCDFRLIRRGAFDHITLYSTSGTICLELVKKLQDLGCVFSEVAVHHFHRAYGRSQFFSFKRLGRTAAELSRLWFQLVILREHQRPSRALRAPETVQPQAVAGEAPIEL